MYTHTQNTCTRVYPGTVLRADVAGKVVLKTFLSDMPELRLGLNDAAQDATFHQ